MAAYKRSCPSARARPLAVGCAGVLFSAWFHTLPKDSDLFVVHNIANTLIILTVVLLLSGKKVEKVLERLSWMMSPASTSPSATARRMRS